MVSCARSAAAPPVPLAPPSVSLRPLPTQPFSLQPAPARPHRVAQRHRQPLTPIGLLECRHTFASLMIAARVNAKALSTHLGHSSIQITLDRYGRPAEQITLL